LYAKLGEPKKAEIEAKYMELAKTSPLYGVTFFDVVVCNCIQVYFCALNDVIRKMLCNVN
jgi:hypothetical protein